MSNHRTEVPLQHNPQPHDASRASPTPAVPPADPGDAAFQRALQRLRQQNIETRRQMMALRKVKTGFFGYRTSA